MDRTHNAVNNWCPFTALPFLITKMFWYVQTFFLQMSLCEEHIVEIQLMLTLLFFIDYIQLSFVDIQSRNVLLLTIIFPWRISCFFSIILFILSWLLFVSIYFVWIDIWLELQFLMQSCSVAVTENSSRQMKTKGRFFQLFCNFIYSGIVNTTQLNWIKTDQ